MYHISDKDLDRLSKDAADNFEPEQGISDWENLEQSLNKELPQDKNDRRKFLFLLLLIVLFSGTGMVWTTLSKKQKGVEEYASIEKNLTNNNPQPRVENNGPAPDKNPNRQNATTDDDYQGSAGPSAANTKSDPRAKAGSNRNSRFPESAQASGRPKKAGRDKNTISLPSSKNNRAEDPSPRKRATTNTIPDAPLKPHVKDADDDGLKDNAADAGNIITYDSRDRESDMPRNPSNDVKQKQGSDTITQQKNIIGDDKDNAIAKKDSAAAEANKDSGTARPAKKKIKKSFAQLEIGVTAGPDLSSVNNAYSAKPGYNAGIQLGYRFAERWSAHTGLIYTKKNYGAKGKDFHPPKDYWINYVYLHKVEGNCFMLDIPLNIRYVALSGKKNKLFIGSGLSTYFMSKESYTYDYTLNGVDKSAEWTNYKNSSFLFSIWNLSAGYEKAMSKHLSLQVEPYMKLPLKGIGFGTMQLDSYGIYFSLIYKPSLK